ncbi:MAG: PHP domain-containing protein, partial [Planctomycetota bacterium]
MDFAHLHVHSNYSLLQGAFSVQELIETASELGMPAVALTDTNGLYGALFFYDAAREAGIKPIIGAEIVYGREQCVCLAADRQGYANVCRIVTERKLADTPHYADFLASEPGARDENAEFDLAESIAADPRGLFVLTATPSLLHRLKGIVPDGRLYAEVRADGPRSFETRCPFLRGAGAPRKSGSRSSVADVAERLGIPPVATVNVNFLQGESRHTHAVLSAIRENVDLKSLLARSHMLAGPQSFLQ